MLALAHRRTPTGLTGTSIIKARKSWADERAVLSVPFEKPVSTWRPFPVFTATALGASLRRDGRRRRVRAGYRSPEADAGSGDSHVEFEPLQSER
jgi:hypothetical protein